MSSLVLTLRSLHSLVIRFNLRTMSLAWLDWSWLLFLIWSMVIYYGVLTTVLVSGKVETILKGSLDLIPSLSVKIQIICGKV